MFSIDNALIGWDQVIISTKSHEVDETITLEQSEEICRMGGFSHDSSIAVYGVDRRPLRTCLRDIPSDQLSTFNPEHLQSGTQEVIGYNRTTGQRQLIISTTSLSLLCTHPT